jgi:molybdopterin molybdotransferase
MTLAGASLESALSALLARTEPADRVAWLPLASARGLVSAERVLASVDNPPFDRSPLDGFALRSYDTLGASPDTPVRLRIIGTVYAGQPPPPLLKPGDALRLMTGTPMPEGSDCVVPKELVTEADGLVELRAPLSHHENYVLKGEDVKKGAVFIEPGDRLDHARLGMLAAMGHAEAAVHPPPIVGLASVGDELAQPGFPLPPGMIYNSNGVMLEARLAEYGLDVRTTPALPDVPESVAEAISEALEVVDVMITSGSVSVGDKDVLPAALSILGAEIEISRLDFKPGSAFLCGIIRGKRIFCLSGNPFAALATLELVARPVLAVMARQDRLRTRRRRAVIRDAFPGGRGRGRRFLRGRLIEREGALPEVTLPEGHSSGRLFSLAGCDCLVDLAAGSANPVPGDVVDVVALSLPV